MQRVFRTIQNTMNSHYCALYSDLFPFRMCTYYSVQLVALHVQFIFCEMLLLFRMFVGDRNDSRLHTHIQKHAIRSVRSSKRVFANQQPTVRPTKIRENNGNEGKKTNTTNRNQFLIQFERVVCEMRVCGRMQAIECECKCELSARVCPSLSCMQRCVQCKCIGLVAFVFVCAFMLVLHYQFEIYWSLACCYCNGIVTASCIHTHMYVVHFLH